MWKDVSGHILAVLFGVILGFFLVIAPLFADSGTAVEYLLALFILDLFFFTTGLVFGYVLPGKRMWIGLSVPSAVMALIFFIIKKPDEFFHVLIFIVFPMVAVFASIGGGMLGGLIRSRREHKIE